MNPSPPRSIDDYLHALRAALAGADPALIQDALVRRGGTSPR